MHHKLNNHTQPFITNTGNVPLRAAYGENILVTYLGQIRIIHTDQPSKETIEQRIREVIEDELNGESLEPDCPLCQHMAQYPYDIVYTSMD